MQQQLLRCEVQTLRTPADHWHPSPRTLRPSRGLPASLGFTGSEGHSKWATEHDQGLCTRHELQLTGIRVFVAAPQQVDELLAAFALSVAPGRVEAQLLHQDQRLLTQVFIPVPRHPPICIALRTSSLSQWRRRPRRPHLSDCERPPHSRGSASVSEGVGPSGEGARCLDHRDQVPMHERTTTLRRLSVPAGSGRGSGRK